MSTNQEVTLDADYVRFVGNEIHDQLFPRPRKDNPAVQPLPLPIAVDYHPAEGVRFEVLFVSERIIKRTTGEEAPDVRPSQIRVVLPDQGEVFLTDLVFGKEPTGHLALDDPQEREALDALLRAVTGVLTSP